MSNKEHIRLKSSGVILSRSLKHFNVGVKRTFEAELNSQLQILSENVPKLQVKINLMKVLCPNEKGYQQDCKK